MIYRCQLKNTGHKVVFPVLRRVAALLFRFCDYNQIDYYKLLIKYKGNFECEKADVFLIDKIYLEKRIVSSM